MSRQAGLGGNIATHDVANLAWNLAFGIKNQAGKSLYRTCAAERAPVDATVVRFQARHYVDYIRPEMNELVKGTDNIPDYPTVSTGYVDTSDAICENNRDAPASFEDPRWLSGRCGARLTHICSARIEGAY